MIHPRLQLVGVMSGTSLDGLDLALCQFEGNADKSFSYKILAAETVTYDTNHQQWLLSVMDTDALGYIRADHAFGRFIGQQVHSFLSRHSLEAQCIASHGHTIFHDPKNGYTAQIGHGADIHAETNLPVITDFRSLDVALGGQGAPLVPIGDLHLFSKYTFCLNLGGIANISYQKYPIVQACDVCPANLVLNHLALQAGQLFDKDGGMARSGKIVPDLLHSLNTILFYKQNHPKSLGKEDVMRDFIPIIDTHEASLADKMATYCEHIALQITNQVQYFSSSTKRCGLLATGGGALHTYLIERIQHHCNSIVDVTVPDLRTVQFKEALIFAFLGYLHLCDLPNSLQSVTGAQKDSIGGILWGNKK